MLKDVLHGVRVLVRAKGWTVVVILSLALGIGANAALFSAVSGLLLKELAVSDPATLVRVRYAGRNDMVTSSSDYGVSAPVAGQPVRATFSYPIFQELRAANRTLADMFAAGPLGTVNVVVDGGADTARAFISTGNYFRVLGVTAHIGRTILPEDDRPEAPPVAVISHSHWRQRFGSDPNVLGKVVRIGDVPITIVGVLPREFTGIQRPIGDVHDISVPLALDSRVSGEPKRLSEPTNYWLHIMGRLKPGVTAAQVQGNLDGVFRQAARAGLDGYLASLPEEQRSNSRNRIRTSVPSLIVHPGGRGIYDARPEDVRMSSVLGAVVAAILLIVCANVANLLLSRATARQKELSIRLSMGATRGRLVRQLLTESVLLASIGGAIGVLVGYWGAQLLPGVLGKTSPLDWRVLGFVVAVTVATGVVFGIAPALRATGINVNTALKESSRSVARSRTLLGRILLAAQVAISLVLLIGAGLFLRTVQNLREVDVGFDPRNLVLFHVDPRMIQYDRARALVLFQSIVDRVGTIPGVRGVTISHVPLLSGGRNATGIFVDGRAYDLTRRDHDNGTHRLVVWPNFFETMGMPLVVGRGFSTRDSDGAPKVAVINQTAARKFFPGENPIGRRFGHSIETSGEFEIVGVLRDAKYDAVRDPAPPTMYVPFLQSPTPNNAVYEVRTAGDPAAAIGAIREAVRRVHPTLPLMNVNTQMERVEQRLTQEKLFAQAYALFGGLALVLASIGLFGLMSYSVARRTNEIGIRMAIGAERRDVASLVMRESMALVAAGVAVGLAIATASNRLLESQLFGIAPTDIVTTAVAVATMIAVSAAASYIPARRASRVDPLTALRYE